MITSNFIGQYSPDLAEKENILNIFVTPNLEGDQIFMHQLNINHSIHSKSTNVYTNRHLTEGQKFTFPSIKESDKTNNNLHCVCDHT